MSHGSIEYGDIAKLRAAFEAAAQGDIEAVAPFVSPDFVFDDHTVPEDTTAERGMNALRAEFARLDEAFDSYRVELLELSDLGGSRLLGVLRTSGRGTGSGVEIEGEVGEVLTLRDGLVVRADVYPSPAEARRATGLDPA